MQEGSLTSFAYMTHVAQTRLTNNHTSRIEYLIKSDNVIVIASHLKLTKIKSHWQALM